MPTFPFRQRSKATGIDTTTRLNVMARADNCCERCGISVVNVPADLDHRRTRGMGGAKHANHPANISLLCRDCHQWKHDQPNEAHRTGWMVRQWEDPETVPLTDLYGHRFLFDGERRVDL